MGYLSVRIHIWMVNFGVEPDHGRCERIAGGRILAVGLVEIEGQAPFTAFIWRSFFSFDLSLPDSQVTAWLFVGRAEGDCFRLVADQLVNFVLQPRQALFLRLIFNILATFGIRWRVVASRLTLVSPGGPFVFETHSPGCDFASHLGHFCFRFDYVLVLVDVVNIFLHLIEFWVIFSQNLEFANAFVHCLNLLLSKFLGQRFRSFKSFIHIFGWFWFWKDLTLIFCLHEPHITFSVPLDGLVFVSFGKIQLNDIIFLQNFVESAISSVFNASELVIIPIFGQDILDVASGLSALANFKVLICAARTQENSVKNVKMRCCVLFAVNAVFIESYFCHFLGQILLQILRLAVSKIRHFEKFYLRFRRRRFSNFWVLVGGVDGFGLLFLLSRGGLASSDIWLRRIFHNIIIIFSV